VYSCGRKKVKFKKDEEKGYRRQCQECEIWKKEDEMVVEWSICKGCALAETLDDKNKKKVKTTGEEKEEDYEWIDCDKDEVADFSSDKSSLEAWIPKSEAEIPAAEMGQQLKQAAAKYEGKPGEEEVTEKLQAAPLVLYVKTKKSRSKNVKLEGSLLVNGAPVKVMFDTGSELNLMSEKEARQRNLKVQPGYHIELQGVVDGVKGRTEGMVQFTLATEEGLNIDQNFSAYVYKGLPVGLIISRPWMVKERVIMDMELGKVCIKGAMPERKAAGVYTLREWKVEPGQSVELMLGRANSGKSDSEVEIFQ
jgi:hypothetical protein